MGARSAGFKIGWAPGKAGASRAARLALAGRRGQDHASFIPGGGAPPRIPSDRHASALSTLAAKGRLRVWRGSAGSLSVGALVWVGRQARWVLVVGCSMALVFPVAAETMRPLLPGLVALVVMMGMLRIDLMTLIRQAARPRRLAGVLALSAALLVIPAVAVWAALVAVGLPDHGRVTVYTYAAAPIASSATLCLIMGLNAALALEVTVAMSALMPLIGPAVVFVLIGAEVDISPVELSLRMAAMIGAGAAAAVALRRLIGVERLHRNGQALDGAAVVVLLLFVIPLYDGVGEMIQQSPWLALSMLALAVAVMWGPMAMSFLIPRLAPQDAGALGIIGGTRTVAIYLAAVPPDPAFTLYVALYQFPMLGIPLAFQSAWRRRMALK